MSSIFGGGASTPSGTGVMGSEEMSGAPVGSSQGLLGGNAKQYGAALRDFGKMQMPSQASMAPNFAPLSNANPNMTGGAQTQAPGRQVVSISDLLRSRARGYPRRESR